MAQASRRRTTTNSTSSSCKYWKWLVTGLVVGIISGWYLGASKEITKNLIKEQNPIVDAFKVKLKDEKNKVVKPKFDFYTLLPDMEVEVPVEEIRKPPTKPEPEKTDTNKAQIASTNQAGTKTGDTSATKQPAATIPPSALPTAPPPKETATVYLLQMGSFSTLADADRLKARLAMQGVETDIQTITISNAQGKATMYRVRSGPYNQSQVQSAHKNVQEAGVNGVIIRVK